MSSLSPSKWYTHAFIVKRNWRALIYGSLTLLFVDAMSYSLPLLVKAGIARLRGGEFPNWVPPFFRDLSATHFVLVICCVYFSFSALAVTGRYGWRKFFIWSNFPWIHDLRAQTYSHLLNLHRDFFKTRKTGDLISAITTDTDSMRFTVSFGALALIDTLINLIAFPAILFWLDWKLTAVILPPLVIIGVGAIFISRTLSKGYDEVQDRIADLSGLAYEIASGVRVIKAFAREEPVHEEFLKKSEELRDVSKRVARLQSPFTPGLDLALGLAVSFVILFGGGRVLAGEMSVSTFVAFLLYLGLMDWPMQAMGWFIQMYRQSSAAQKRLQAIGETETPLRIEKANGEEGIRKSSHDLRTPIFSLKRVSYRYPEKKVEQLKDISFELEAGQWVGVTGPVASGKTTILELLSRQRDPSSGCVEFWGKNVKEISPAEMARRVMFVPQESFLFSRSIRKNLEMGQDVSQSDQELFRLLSDLKFDLEWLEKRGGLGAVLGERGLNFSGGQRQRLALGRAMNRNREVWLLDDLFSHVDGETEAHLLATLKARLKPPATVVLVSQRVPTLSVCDRVCVLNNGRLEYFGTFEGGLKGSPFLRRMRELAADFERKNAV